MVDAHTFDRDDVHALHGIEGAQAGVDRAVHQLVILTAGHHDCAGSAAALSAAQLGACQAQLCRGHSAFMAMQGLRSCSLVKMQQVFRQQQLLDRLQCHSGGKPRQGHMPHAKFFGALHRGLPRSHCSRVASALPVGRMYRLPFT